MRKQSPTLYLVLIIVFLVMSFLIPSRFLTLSNFRSMAYQLPLLGFLSLGMMIPILCGGINLAIVSTSNFTGIIVALLLRTLSSGNSEGASIPVTIISICVGIFAALGAGALSGILIGRFRVPDMLATLGTMMLLNGINIVLTRGYTLTGFPRLVISIGNGLLYGIPIPFLIFVFFVFIVYVLLNKTLFGYSLYMTGSNYVAARFSNIDTSMVILKSYLLSSFLASVNALIMIGQLNSVKANYAESYLLVSILACFLGGLDPAGGAGRLSEVILAIFTLQLISSGVNLLRMDPFFIRAMWGFIIIAVILMEYLAKGRFNSSVIKREGVK